MSTTKEFSQQMSDFYPNIPDNYFDSSLILQHDDIVNIEQYADDEYYGNNKHVTIFQEE